MKCLVRKGISRKAQLSLQIKRHVSKHPDSVLKTAVPLTIVLETWGAFEDDMKLDFGRGTYAVFDSPSVLHVPLRQKLDWCLYEAKEMVEAAAAQKDCCWILKPSVTNKGMDIAVARTWEDICTKLEECSDIREWVLQSYIDRPLLLAKHKFHLRVYVLCVGALRVYVYNNFLVLLAAHR
jgi:tubulin--tyrosine ligase